AQRAPGSLTGTHEGGVGDRGKSTRALGAALRERGQRAAVQQVTGAVLDELVPLVQTRRVGRAGWPATREPVPAASPGRVTGQPAAAGPAPPAPRTRHAG